MRAVVMERYGGPDVLEARDDAPEPALRADELLVEVKAAGVNPADAKIRAGAMRGLVRLALPAVLGYDVSGVVRQVGSRVSRFRVGDEVFARKNADGRGTYAELAPVRERDAARKPSNLTHEEAAAVPTTGLAAWSAVREKLRVKGGHRVLVTGGAGGVGGLAIQLAKDAGAYVATTASGAKMDAARKLGADFVVDYKAEDPKARLHGYDAALDTVGDFETALAAIRDGGRVATTVGLRPIEKLAAELGPRRAIVAAGLGVARGKWRAYRAKRATYSLLAEEGDGETLSRLASAIARGAARPVVDRVLPLESAREAHEALEARQVAGKIVLRP